MITQVPAIDYVFPPPAVVGLPVANLPGLFPVHRVYCVGRNYDAHAWEMGHDPKRSPPFFFQKNPDCLVTEAFVPYPSRTGNLHHEVELVVLLGSGGSDIPPEAAPARVFGYAVGIDLTRRDLQDEAKRLQRPWETSKSFDKSAPIGPVIPAAGFDPSRGAITLEVNGETRQSGDLSLMTWKVPEIIAHLSGFYELQAGDVIYTGTPAGVGPVVRGDRMRARIEGLGEIVVTVA